MSLRHSSPQTGLQFRERFSRSALREKRGVNLLGGVRTRSANYDPFPIFFPLQDGARRKAELATHLCGHGDLPLGGEFG